MVLSYCPHCDRFLPDRYVEGTCPHCGNIRARGDQCDSCGRTLDPKDLLDIRCVICGTAPEFRESEHLFFRLSSFQEPLLEWVRQQTHLAAQRLEFHPPLLGRRAEGPGRHPGHLLGRDRPGGGLRGQADLRLV